MRSRIAFVEADAISRIMESGLVELGVELPLQHVVFQLVRLSLSVRASRARDFVSLPVPLPDSVRSSGIRLRLRLIESSVRYVQVRSRALPVQTISLTISIERGTMEAETRYK